MPWAQPSGELCGCHLRWDEGTCPAAVACWVAGTRRLWDRMCTRCARHNYCTGAEHVPDGPGCYGPSVDAGMVS